MKKNVYLLLIAILLFCFRASAQNFAVGFRGGVGLADLSTGADIQLPSNIGYNSRTVPVASIFADFKFSDLFSMQPMLEYSSQGGIQTTNNNELRLNYLIVPVLAKFTFKITQFPLRFYWAGGPFLGFLTSARQISGGSAQNITGQFHTINIGVDGNIGICYPLGRNAVFIETGGNYGVLNIQKGSENATSNTGAITLVVGYSYWFGKK
jgi:hypothetical protein